MLKKKYFKIIAMGMVATCLMGSGMFEKNNTIFGAPTIAYAQTVSFSDSFNPNKYGKKTDMGWITAKVTLKDNMPDDATLEDLKAMAVEINPEDNPEYFYYWTNPISGKKSLNLDYHKMQLTDTIYYWSYTDKYGYEMDEFIKILGMKVVDSNHDGGQVYKTYTKYVFEDGEKTPDSLSSSTRQITANYIDVPNAILLQNEKDQDTTPTPNPGEQAKKYSSVRLGGANRFTTATAIAKEVNGSKLDSVVIANAFNFPDALTGTTLAGQKKSPILLVGSDIYDSITLNYLKANLKSNGTVYLLGGNSVVTDKVVKKIKSLGFNNIKRLGGANRYDTNISIINELNVPKGTDIVIANSNSYADSLSIAGVAGGKNMPILLVKDTLTSTVANKIKSIAPKNIYIVGGASVVNVNIEKQLKSYGNVVRLGGSNRFETSLKVASRFTSKSQTNAAIAYSHDFPDALTGGVLASKTSSPVLLVRGDTSAQKAFLDKTKITKLYILGGTGVISDATVKQLTK